MKKLCLAGALGAALALPLGLVTQNRPAVAQDMGGDMGGGNDDDHEKGEHKDGDHEDAKKDACHVAHAKGGTVEMPCHDEKKLTEVQGLDGKLTAKVTIAWPKEGDEVKEADAKKPIEFKLENYNIGKDEKGDWQHCHVILDSKPYQAAYDAKTITLEACNGGKPLDAGWHLLTIFPSRNYHLSVKNEGACAQVRFFVKEKKGEVPKATDPQLVYSRPKGDYLVAEKQNEEILLDFYLLNCKLAPDGHKVHAVVHDEKGAELEKHELTKWWPITILKGAKPGKYKVTLVSGVL